MVTHYRPRRCRCCALRWNGLSDTNNPYQLEKNMSEMTIVEINGVKMEVDLRHAKIVHENLRVGTKVKVLTKNDYSGPSVYAGVIVGFEPFPSLPTIIVAYIDTSFTGGLKFAYINSKSAEKWEIVPSLDDELPIAKNDVLAQFDRQIEQKEAELRDLNAKRDFFLRHFNAYFEHFAAKQS